MDEATKTISNFHAKQSNDLFNLITKKEEKSFHECTSNCRREGCPNCEHGYDEEHTCSICDEEEQNDDLFDKHQENPDLIII